MGVALDWCEGYEAPAARVWAMEWQGKDAQRETTLTPMRTALDIDGHPAEHRG